MSDQRDQLLERLVAAVAEFGGRLTRLEKALQENAELKLEVAELEAAHTTALSEQEEINDLLAERLGRVLVKIEPKSPRSPGPRLVVDNDNSSGDR